MLDFHSYQLRGYEVVVTPSGKCLIHKGTRFDRLVHEAETLDEAFSWVQGTTPKSEEDL